MIRYLLFKNISVLNDKRQIENIESDFSISIISPTICGLLKHNVTIRDYFWKIIALGRYSKYCVSNGNGDIVHYSTVIGKCIKFKFLTNTNSYEIGPCFTKVEYRGKGIYPYVLSKIISDEAKDYYMLVRQDNLSSIRGIEKAGFKQVGYACKHHGIWRKTDEVERIQ